MHLRRLIAFGGVIALFVLPALCSVVDCSLGAEVKAPVHPCCPHNKGTGSEQKPSHSHAVQTCPYQFLEKGKKPATVTVAGPAIQAVPLAPAFAAVELVRVISRTIGHEKSYLLNRVLLI